MDSNGEMEFLTCQRCGGLPVSLVIHMAGLVVVCMHAANLSLTLGTLL